MRLNKKIRRSEGAARTSLLIFLIFLFDLSCGYHAVYGGEVPARLHVKLVRSLVSDAVTGDEVASGVREELAREGALEAGDGWPRAEIDVLRDDEASEGIAVDGGAPEARGLEVGIVARAWIAPSPGAAPLHDTGDMRVADLISVDVASSDGLTPDPRGALFHHTDALRAAARRLGYKLGRKLLGHPAASEDTVDR